MIRLASVEVNSNAVAIPDKGPRPRGRSGPLVAACHVDPVEDAVKELDHVLQKSPAVAVQTRLIAAHSGAVAARKNESGHGPWR